MNIMFDLKCESSSGEEEETEGGEPTDSSTQISRCANVSSADLDELEHNRNESSTVKQTIWAVNCFKAWLREKQLTIDFKTAEKSELNPVLREFYGSIRTSKGELYGISSYVGLRAGLNRFINDPPLNRAWNLMQDAEFRSANNVFKGVVKQMRRSGRDITAHYPPISLEDQHMLKHSAALDPGNPKGLLNKVWYDIQLHFGLRGKEGNRHLQPNAFVLNRDQNGFKYFTMTLNEDMKNPQEREGKRKRKAMYEEPGNPLCPVASLEKYLSKIPADAKALYLQPKRTYFISDEIWYTTLPLGVNYLSQMLPKICKEAGTRTIYTNHSLRLTSIQRMNETREIMAVCLHSVPVEISTQWQQESVPYSPSSELDSSSAKQESPVSSHSWVKQEPEPEVIQQENMNSEAATDAEQDKSLSSAVATEPPMEGLPSSVMLTITKLQCLLESKQERIDALERQVQDLQEDRKFLRSQIENLTGARLVSVPEVPKASTSMFSEPRSRKRRRKSSSSSSANDESFTDESSSTSSSEESSSVRKKRRHKKKGKRGCVSQRD
ncbi:zinc finger MYM-type protein 2 isoform X3 [Ctenopharyngodon idella]|uniref:zinc finger MYM-type protein 2 isoform X3 n=1 Tax=Ctenopharyngodon idella TaxID=7959 RepID=UPI00222E5E39|nr:zinc finger MYM-type protein 2 isoform X3 [Ctenopharyngodon idella]